jgi:protein-S-isoprenylcysteine O-methyltransferase Ste14
VYAIGLVGDFLVPKTIDSGLRVPTAEALIVDVVLLGLFAVPHRWDQPHVHEWFLNLDAAVQVAHLPRIPPLRTNLRKGRVSRDNLIP